MTRVHIKRTTLAIVSFGLLAPAAVEAPPRRRERPHGSRRRRSS